MQKVILFGFPHCGTSILKAILGHVDGVREMNGETKEAALTKEQQLQEEEAAAETETTDGGAKKKVFVLCKWPFTCDAFFSDAKYADYHKIFLLRHPFFVFTSLNARFGDGRVPEDHSVARFVQTAERFRAERADPGSKVHTLRYEDLFADDFRALRAVLDAIFGVEGYTDRVFDNGAHYNTMDKNIPTVATARLAPTDHYRYRHWQINQPFENNNDPRKIRITEAQRAALLQSDAVRALWGPDAPDEVPPEDASPVVAAATAIEVSSSKKRSLSSSDDDNSLAQPPLAPPTPPAKKKSKGEEGPDGG